MLLLKKAICSLLTGTGSVCATSYLSVHLCYFPFYLPSCAVPVFEEHPDISQGVPRQVRPAQQRAVRPFRPLWCQGLRQGELSFTWMDVLLFLPFKMLVKKMVPPLGSNLTTVGTWRHVTASVTDNLGTWLLFGCCQIQTFNVAQAILVLWWWKQLYECELICIPVIAEVKR